MKAILFLCCIILVVLEVKCADTWAVTNGKLTKNGKPTRVQGVSLSCTEFDSPVDKNTDGSYVCPHIGQDRKPSPILQALPKLWDAQIIRIPVNSQWYLWDINTGYPAGPAGCQFASTWAGQDSPYGKYSPQGYRDWIDDHVNGATSIGMIAMIDLHWSDMDGTACCDNGKDHCYQGCQQTMADHKSLAFWEYVGKKYCNRSDVWFELYNEPAYDLGQGNTSIPLLMKGGRVNTIQYKNGCPASPLSSFEFIGMQDMYNVIRDKLQCDNIVVVGGADWAWSWNGVLIPPRKPSPGLEWCHNNYCQRGCGIDVGVDFMVESSPRGEGYPAPVSWSPNKKWGKNVVYNTHPYEAKGGQQPTPNQKCSDWIESAVNGSGSNTWLCAEQCGWEVAFGFFDRLCACDCY